MFVNVVNLCALVKGGARQHLIFLYVWWMVILLFLFSFRDLSGVKFQRFRKESPPAPLFFLGAVRMFFLGGGRSVGSFTAMFLLLLSRSVVLMYQVSNLREKKLPPDEHEC